MHPDHDRFLEYSTSSAPGIPPRWPHADACALRRPRHHGDTAAGQSRIKGGGAYRGVMNSRALGVGALLGLNTQGTLDRRHSETQNKQVLRDFMISLISGPDF